MKTASIATACALAFAISAIAQELPSEKLARIQADQQELARRFQASQEETELKLARINDDLSALITALQADVTVVKGDVASIKADIKAIKDALPKPQAVAQTWDGPRAVFVPTPVPVPTPVQATYQSYSYSSTMSMGYDNTMMGAGKLFPRVRGLFGRLRGKCGG